jgi:hypothetical protein
MQTVVIVLSGLFGIVCGIVIALMATLRYDLFWAWSGILGVVAIPVLCGIYAHWRGYRRLAIWNLVGSILSFLVVTLWGGGLSLLRGFPVGPVQQLLGGLFVLILGILIFGLVVRLLPLPDTMLICTDGCIFISRFQQRRVVRWNQITSMYLEKKLTSIVYRDGRTLKLYGAWAGSKHIQQIMYGKAFRYLFAHARNTYQSGEPVEFGRFTITWQGIHNGKRLLAWDDLHSCEYVQNGLALISKDGTCLDMTSISQLPNATIFYELVRFVLATRNAAQ